ncbi:MAG: hypothetical protein H8E66_31535 [Planctomycetes bacterium]|nr:hypothetical protein [Planctomycetota bacterium]
MLRPKHIQDVLSILSGEYETRDVPILHHRNVHLGRSDRPVHELQPTHHSESVVAIDVELERDSFCGGLKEGSVEVSEEFT